MSLRALPSQEVTETELKTKKDALKGLKVAQLASYDDFITDIMVDQVSRSPSFAHHKIYLSNQSPGILLVPNPQESRSLLPHPPCKGRRGRKTRAKMCGR